MSKKAQLNKCDLSARLKAGLLSIGRSAVGRLFHITGPQTENAASRTEFVRVVRRRIW